ncbi:MAG: hypothetical protein IJB57_02065 [Clostridia bacterium]|nr:hypothetical protein [Clostridia bacterium]
MLCRIADLTVEIPSDGSLAPRCKDYMLDTDQKPDIIIDDSLYPYEKFPQYSKEAVEYTHSGLQFYRELLDIGGMMLHSSAVEYNGYAYLFSGPSGMGKSTHTGLWCRTFKGARVINDDKPALRKIDGVWYAYGTPWSGKSFLNVNTKVKVAGICFLERGDENRIRKLSKREALVNIIAQTTRKKLTEIRMDAMLSCVGKLLEDIPFFEMECLPDTDAVYTAYKAMCPNSKEKNDEN